MDDVFQEPTIKDEVESGVKRDQIAKKVIW